MKYLILLFFPTIMFSQTINGKVYDNTSTAKGIKVYNLSKKILTYTNSEGDFTMEATVNDTLLFESIFHISKMVRLKETNFKDIVVFEINKRVNELDEVLLSNEKAENFNPLEYTNVAEEAMKRDIDRNLHLYIPQSSYSNGMNFVALAKMIGKLFKRKNKPKPVELITYQHLDSLFKKDDLFNVTLLHKDLKIPEEHANLFLDYCETKNLNKSLISEGQKVILLDSMVNFSKEFLKITNGFEASKDSLSLKN